MTAIKATQVDAFVARPDAGRPIVLIFGPDAGLVRERAEALIRGAVDDPRDPFALARLAGDELAAEPMRLVEEANTIPLFGGRRAVWVKAGSRNFVPAVEALVAAAPPDCRVVIEAGDLKRNAPLRALCERAPNAVALHGDLRRRGRIRRSSPSRRVDRFAQVGHLEGQVVGARTGFGHEPVEEVIDMDVVGHEDFDARPIGEAELTGGKAGTRSARAPLGPEFDGIAGPDVLPSGYGVCHMIENRCLDGLFTHGSSLLLDGTRCRTDQRPWLGNAGCGLQVSPVRSRAWTSGTSRS